MNQDNTLFSWLSSDRRLAALADDPRPAMAWRRDGRTLAWSNDAGAQLLGLALTDIAANGVMLGAATLAPQIEAVGRRLADSSAIRLERLRFPGAGRLEALACACRLLPLQDGVSLILVTALAAPRWLRPVRQPALPPTEALLSDVAFQTPAPISAEALATLRSDHPALSAFSGKETSSLPANDAEPSHSGTEEAPVDPRLAAAQERAARVKPIRFVFSADAEGRFTTLSEELGTAIGPVAEGWTGLRIAEIGVADEAARATIAQAIAASQGFTRHVIAWVDEDDRLSTTIELSATPSLGPDRAIVGFRGFGICRPPVPVTIEVLAEDEPEPVAAAAEAVTPSPEPELQAVPEALETAPPVDDVLIEAPQAIEMPTLEDPFTDVSAFGQVAFSAPHQDLPQDLPTVEVMPADATSEDIAPGLVDTDLPQDSGIEIETGLTPHDLGDPVDLDVAFVDPPKAPTTRIETAPGTVVAFPEPKPEGDSNVVSLRGKPGPVDRLTLSPNERNAFREIARALGARMEDEDAQSPPVGAAPAVTGPATDEAQWAADSAAEEDGNAPDTSPSAPISPPLALPGIDDPIRLIREKLRQETPAMDVTGAPIVAAAAPPPAPVQGLTMAPAFLDRLSLGFLVVRGEEILFANDAVLSMLGYADIDAMKAAGGLAGMFAGQGIDTLSGEAKALVSTARGETVAVDGRLHATMWNGESALLVTLRRPIEEEMAASLRSAESNAAAAIRRADELQAVLDTATDGVVIVDGEGTIIGLNRSAEALFGYEAVDVAGEPLAMLLSPESHRSAIDYLDGLKRNGVASVLNDGREITGLVRQGGRVPLFMTMGRLGEGDRFCAVLRDITQFKRAEQELVAAKRQAEEASSHKSDFLAKVSHEIRTPLNAIIGFAEVMMEERFGPIGNDRYRSYLRDVHGAGEHVMGLVNDLLDLAKIEAGKLELSFTAISINDIVEQCVGIMQPQANRERILIRTSLARTLPNVVADGRTLRQVVLNLLSNSVKFTPKGGQVIVSTTLTEQGEAVLRVRDTGVGMTDKELAIAMEPFRQIASSQRGGGTGLGLPLTKALVEANRAAFVIQSAKSNGTMAEVIFPPTRVLAE